MSVNFPNSLLCSDRSYAAKSESFIEYFEAYLSDLLKNLDPEVYDYASRVCLAGGKRIRPLLVYNFGCFSDEKSANIGHFLKASAILEMVHVATLVHDDFLDGAETRRSVPTLHTQMNPHHAVLLGDALFSYALELASEFSSSQICKIVARATKRTCSGEIRQTFSRGSWDISLPEYISFINDKTGELFRASCEIGAFLSGHDKEAQKNAAQFGLSLGINYQVYDDLIDAFGDPQDTGKTLRTDWKTGKITLPLILLLKKVSSSEKDRLLALFSRSPSTEDFPSGNRELCELFETHQILEECKTFLFNRFSHTQLLADQLSNPKARQNLGDFLATFSNKLTSINTLQTSNFLAC